MSIITKVLKQTAIYWAPTGGFDKFGQALFSAPEEITCRWIDKTEEVITPDGTKVLSQSRAMVSKDVQVGGILMLGELDSTVDAIPKNNPGAHEIVQFGKVPNFRCTEFVRTAYMCEKVY